MTDAEAVLEATGRVLKEVRAELLDRMARERELLERRIAVLEARLAKASKKRERPLP